MERLRVRIGVGLAALTLGMSFASAAFAQSTYYPNDRRLDDNGSVYEPGSALSMNANTNADTNTRQTRRRAHLVNYAPHTSPTGRQYYANDRRADDNGSVDEPGPGAQ
jgi:hypothetical protein